MFKVDTILAIFVFIVKLLSSTQEKNLRLAEKHAASIDDLEAAKRGALSEAYRAKAVAEKLHALIS
jgi:hypothetical protein